MDQMLRAFRKASRTARAPAVAAALLVGVAGAGRRVLAATAAHGIGLDAVATALGVSPWSLQRWARTVAAPCPRFRDVRSSRRHDRHDQMPVGWCR